MNRSFAGALYLIQLILDLIESIVSYGQSAGQALFLRLNGLSMFGSLAYCLPMQNQN